MCPMTDTKEQIGAFFVKTGVKWSHFKESTLVLWLKGFPLWRSTLVFWVKGFPFWRSTFVFWHKGNRLWSIKLVLWHKWSHLWRVTLVLYVKGKNFTLSVTLPVKKSLQNRATVSRQARNGGSISLKLNLYLLNGSTFSYHWLPSRLPLVSIKPHFLSFLTRATPPTKPFCLKERKAVMSY